METVRKKFWEYLPEFVYGSIDGTVTTFAIIAGIAGAGLNSKIVLILGFSNVLADGFSMASSNFLSEESERDQAENLETNKKQASPWKTALATFFSFVIVGSIPLLTYTVNVFVPGFISNEFRTASILTLITFFCIGLIRGSVSHRSHIKTAFQTCVIGFIAAVVAYGVGAFLNSIV